jgi:hypothetical protein
MDYRAVGFLEFGALDVRLRTKLMDYFGAATEGDAAVQWTDLTRDHDDQAADLLALAAALDRVAISAAGENLSALDLVERFHLLTGDRLYGRLDAARFEAWRANPVFVIALAGGSIESGTVDFNHGQFGASLHDGFDIQGVTALNRIPRIQWNYRFCDSLADIDIDGYSPWDVFRHPTYANSDPRQWHDRFTDKFGAAGYQVEKVGNVPALKVRDTSMCPALHGHLASGEQANALALVSRVIATLDAGDDIRPAVQAAAVTVAAALRDEHQSPLLPNVTADALVNSTEDDLLGYYTARVNVERRSRLSSLTAVPGVEATAPPSARRTLEAVIANPADLRAMRQLLEEDDARQRAQRTTLDARPEPRLRSVVGTRAWLSTDDRAAFGYPAGTRFVAAETVDLQMLLAPGSRGYELLFAIPRTK